MLDGSHEEIDFPFVIDGTRFDHNNNNITEILKYVTWAREGYPIQPGIPKSHLPEKLPRSNPNALYCKLVSIGSQVRASYVPEGS
jgi:hypothetical protein